MTLPKKIALFYGHVASNIGDLAINGGTINLLRTVSPGANIDVVLIDADASEFLDLTKSSFGDQGDIRFASLKTHGEKAALYLRSPHLLLEEAGVTNADVILLSAGEHLFCYQHEENAKSLFWRTFPAYAAKFLGKKCIQLPSTLGPFETARSSALFSSLLDLTDALAVRDGRSLQMLKTRYAAERPLLLDPAFFLDAPIGAEAQQKHGATALVMRSEGWGIRLSSASRKEQTEHFKSTGYEASKAFAFSLDFATRLLNTTDDVLRVFVQTTADQELADALAKRLPEFLESGRLTIERPCSVQDYLRRLSDVDRIIANRFHALILGLVANRQVYGLYFDTHGHKIPGLFSQLDVIGRCHSLSITEPKVAVTAVLDEIARETDGDKKSLQERVEKLRRDTVAWLDNALQKPTATADARKLHTASVALSDFADAQLRAAVEGNAKKQIELIKKSAQAKEAQWAQQRQQLEDELVATAAENQRLSAVNQAQLEALQHELPNTFSNKLGQALIEGLASPYAAIKLPFRLFKLWREAKPQRPPKKLGGESFSEVIAAFENGGFDTVEKLFASASISSTVMANAYTALARHLRKSDVNQAVEAARLAYMADPKPFRRKWLAFRLYEAGKVLEADALLTTLQGQTQFSASETAKVSEIQGLADNKRRIAAHAKVNQGHVTEHSRDNYFVEKCRADGVGSVVDEILRTYAREGKVGANECIRIAKVLRDAGMPEAEFPLMIAAKELHPSPGILRAFFWSAERSGYVEEACAAIRQIEALLGTMPIKSEAEKLEQLKRSVSYQLALADSVPQLSDPAFTPYPGKVCYILHNSLPFSSGGYATRSHGIATALVKSGLEVVIITRPGYPLDTKPELKAENVPTNDVIDGIPYQRILEPLRNSIPFYVYVAKSADAIEMALRRHKPSVLVAASNYIVALPALIAARRVGIPFVYDIRGFWEITKLSRESGYDATPTYKVQSMMEARVANQANKVFTLTDAMREELISRGVSSEKIQLMPNACDTERFIPMERDNSLAQRLGIPKDIPVIGYIGTFVDYEGLDDLATACGYLKKQGIRFRLLLVGNENTSGSERGPISQSIADIAAAADYSDWLIMTGRVPHEEVHRYYSLIDIAPFPRKPWPVCEMVSPMKPLEAFAMEKAVVVSSVRALQEMVKHDETGLIFEKGNVQSLAEALARLVTDPTLRRKLGKNARNWVKKERTWSASTRVLVSYVKELSQAPISLSTQHRHASHVVGHGQQGALSGRTSPIPTAECLPIWWQSVPIDFRNRCDFVDVTAWGLSGAVEELRHEYESRFGKEVVAKRVPLSNWQRADICNRLISSCAPLNLLDIGSGLGEFVNLFASTNPDVPISSVDVKDYSLWFDRTGRVERIYKSIFDLGIDEARDVVTCFEVIEHLPPERLAEAVNVLRSVAKRKLFVSVPFMESLPLYKGHFTRFDETNLLSLFPDAKFTIFGKGGKSRNKVHAWIMCEINCETA